MFSALMAAKAQEEGMAEADLDRLIEELAVAFNLVDPTDTPVPPLELYVDLHPGIPYLAGVARGSTFILVYEAVGTTGSTAIGGRVVGGPPFDGGRAMGTPGTGTPGVGTTGSTAIGGRVVGGPPFDGGRAMGAPGTGTTGSPTTSGPAVPSSEDTRVCSCGGGACKCLKEDACAVQSYRAGAKWWSRKVMETPPGSEKAKWATKMWNRYRKWVEEAEKQCN
jgi:hypothetical protein